MFLIVEKSSAARRVPWYYSGTVYIGDMARVETDFCCHEYKERNDRMIPGSAKLFSAGSSIKAERVESKTTCPITTP
jgi:hypothetical protein